MMHQKRSPLLSPIRERVLALTLLRPDREWYRSELARELGLTPSTLQRPLARLVETEVLLSRRSGNRVYYRANTDSPTFPELRGILAKTSGLAWVLAEALDALRDRIAAAFVFGSVAAGEESASSDVDLLVVGSVGLAELVPPLSEAAARLGREVNPVIFSESEMAGRTRSGDGFLRSVMDSPRLFVAGTEDDLRRVVGD